MERSDFGTNETTGGADDISFGKTSGSAGAAGSAGATSGSAADTEVSAIGGSGSAASADASGIAGASTTGPVTDGKLATAKQKIGQAKEKVVDRMHATADWIKDRDIDQLKGTIEQQVRDHPGRTLLVAVGLGYLIGRAFRGGPSA
jgi:ElaB/YqjD/DUF883 family membrane-anchored ribosome-binding protein